MIRAYACKLVFHANGSFEMLNVPYLLNAYKLLLKRYSLRSDAMHQLKKSLRHLQQIQYNPNANSLPYFANAVFHFYVKNMFIIMWSLIKEKNEKQVA